MKRKSIIRVLFGMTLMLCMCHIGFAQKKAEYNGIPMRNAYRSSLTFPVYLHLFVGDEIGRPLAHVGVRVNYEVYSRIEPTALVEYGTLINGRTSGNGEMYGVKTITFSQVFYFGYFKIDVYYFGRFYTGSCRLKPGPTYIELKINSRTLEITGEVTYPNNEKNIIQFK